MEIQLHCCFMLSLSSHLISTVLRFQWRFLFNNVNLCKSNIKQIFELIPAIVKTNCLPTYLEIILILFFESPKKLSLGS